MKFLKQTGEEIEVLENISPEQAMINKKAINHIARNLFEKNGLNDWKFEVVKENDNIIGVCIYSANTIGINYNAFYLYDFSKLRNTLLHEISHALTIGHGHDEVWKAKAIEIGCTGKVVTDFYFEKIGNKYKLILEN